MCYSFQVTKYPNPVKGQEFHFTQFNFRRRFKNKDYFATIRQWSRPKSKSCVTFSTIGIFKYSSLLQRFLRKIDCWCHVGGFHLADEIFSKDILSLLNEDEQFAYHRNFGQVPAHLTLKRQQSKIWKERKIKILTNKIMQRFFGLYRDQYICSQMQFQVFGDAGDWDCQKMMKSQ